MVQTSLNSKDLELERPQSGLSPTVQLCSQIVLYSAFTLMLVLLGVT